MNDEHVNASVIIWFLLWLVKHSSSSPLRRPAGLCWRRSSALSSTCCRRLRHRCRSSDWSNLLYEIWKRDLKKGQREVFCVRRCCWARGFTSCPTVWQQTWSDLLTETLTMRTHSWQDVILLFIPPADTSCYTFTQTHTSKQSDVRPERFSLVVWISFCLQLLMEAESLILRVGSSRRLTMRKDEGRAGETLTRVDVHVWVWIKNKTFHFISKRLKNPEITCLTWRNRVKPSAPENRADRSDRIHSWWRLKTVPEERKQNLTEPEWREQNKTREVWSIIWSITDTCWVWTQSFWSESNRTTRSAGVFQDVLVLLDLVCRQQTASCRILFEFCTELIKLVTSF